ncbi:hypothetical protein MASR2M47_20280 [Draconibacterium sp.]|jgi:hypothetical protein
MNSRLNDIFNELENFPAKTRKARRKLKAELERIANSDRKNFEKIVSKIKPSDESILFEIYEALSINPSEWYDFIIFEFRRIKGIAENSQKNLQESVVSPLLAISFFARKEFIGLNKLIYELNQALKSQLYQL